MSGANGIEIVAFDMFGTLARNDASDWQSTVHLIAREQQLGVDGDALWDAFRAREVNFRKTRTNMADPPSSPPFRSYWEAWRDTFVEAFAALGIAGDADSAATRCIDALTDQPPFPDATSMLDTLRGNVRTAVLSNADDRFLDGTVAHNGWEFEAVLSSEAAKAYKPDPRIFQAFVERVAIAPAQVLYVGDSPYDDVHGAKLAGMRTVLVQRDQNTPGRTPPPDATTLHPPDFTVTSLAELPAIILGS